jgi:hypothetical protein
LNEKDCFARNDNSLSFSAACYAAKKEENKHMEEKIGSIAFVVGIAVAIIAGFVMEHWLFLLLTLLGLAVGFLNVTVRESQTFVFIAIGLVIISALAGPQIQSIPEAGKFLARIYAALLLFITPAATVVALKTLFLIARR